MSQVRIGYVREMARTTLQKHRVAAPPVPLEAIASVEGLAVKLILTWPDSVSGLLLRESRLIGINGRHASTRRRFSLSHELGHWFLRHDFPWHEKDVTIDEPPEESTGEEFMVLESEANEFAGELLAPLGMLKAAMKRTRDADELAKLFEMSPESLWVRILRHNLLK